MSYELKLLVKSKGGNSVTVFAIKVSEPNPDNVKSWDAV